MVCGCCCQLLQVLWGWLQFGLLLTENIANSQKKYINKERVSCVLLYIKRERYRLQIYRYATIKQINSVINNNKISHWSTSKYKKMYWSFEFVRDANLYISRFVDVVFRSPFNMNVNKDTNLCISRLVNVVFKWRFNMNVWV